LFAVDAGNPAVIRDFVSQGHLPNFAHALASGRTCVIEHEPGLFVGSVWPSAFTGVGVDRHGFFAGIRHAANSYDYIAAGVVGDPFWVDVSRTGKRVLVIDPPLFAARDDIDADQLIEWGCHDRYYGTRSVPPELLEEVVRDVGPHPLGMIEHEYERFAPCDYVDASGARRDHDETVAFAQTLNEATDLRQKVSKYLNDRDRYDLVIDVVAEVHCAGHHFWHLHNPEHPDHDAALAERLGGDPLLPVYRRVDDVLGMYLADLEPDDTAFVLVSHGMQNHFDGTLLLEELLWRLDQSYGGQPTPWRGVLTERIGRALSRVPGLDGARRARAIGRLVNRRLGARPLEPTESSSIPGPADRLWYPLDNNTVSGAVRFNRLGREPRGQLDAGLAEHAARWLIEELRSIVNVDTGEPAIASAYLTEQLYERRNDDGLPDLMIEWSQVGPIDRIWSPAIGLICAPYSGLRTGDHDRFGELYVLGPGIVPGRRPAMRGIDLAPTVAAATGVYLRDRDGVVIGDLLPTTRRSTLATAAARLERPVERRFALPSSLPSSADVEASALRRDLLALRRELDGLKASHHETRVLADGARHTSGLAVDIIGTTRWIASQEVDETALVSVIVPTRNRAERLEAAIASIVGQSYRNLEVVVVDDGSTDGTPEVISTIDDGRLVSLRNDEPLGEGGARNRGLDAANGDIVCFLDDDNRFDRAWVRSAVWFFAQYPDRDVAYGVRVVDDRRRHQEHVSGGLPAIEQNAWDRETNRHRSLVDVNVLAHRRSGARFDPGLPMFTDWDYLLQLTEREEPTALPVIAAYYSTADGDRVTFQQKERYDEFYRRVVERWGDGPT
jgi:predicted AlkP superfamily phosphohydrolase/phosphomutase